MKSKNIISRRSFIRQAGCAGMSALPLLNTLINLRLMEGVASADTPPVSGEYRALVCILLAGGNDSFNIGAGEGGGMVGSGGGNGVGGASYEQYLGYALQQAIERVGKIDREAVIKDLQTGTFDTVIGKVKLENNMPTRYWWVGQWQDGEFYGVGPAGNEGARAAVVPKPAWKAQ